MNASQPAFPAPTAPYRQPAIYVRREVGAIWIDYLALIVGGGLLAAPFPRQLRAEGRDHAA